MEIFDGGAAAPQLEQLAGLVAGYAGTPIVIIALRRRGQSSLLALGGIGAAEAGRKLEEHSPTCLVIAESTPEPDTVALLVLPEISAELTDGPLRSLRLLTRLAIPLLPLGPSHLAESEARF